MRKILLEVLESIYGQSVEIINSRPVGGGSINQTEVLTLSNREKVFLKTNAHPPDGFFLAEARGLDLLRQAKGGPRVPQVLGLEPGPGQKFLLLEYVENSPPAKEFDVRFAQALAHLHRLTGDSHGLSHDNFIGSTVQKNTPDKNGLIFFRDQRIRFQQELARSSDKFPASLDKRIDTLCGKLETLMDTEGEKPVLVHGDLWSGNYFQTQSDQRPCIFDPAVYYGFRESDLAMTELFGNLPDSFYRAYHEAFPLNPGYAERRGIYNLYHLLNHLNLFGGSYVSSVESIVNHYTC
jgi:protein-ribulosamine 3-kinase